MSTASPILEVPSFAFEIDGAAAPESLYHSVEWVTVEQAINSVNNLRVCLRDVPVEGRYILIDSELLSLGREIAVSLGVVGSRSRMLAGRVRSIRAAYSLDGLAITIEASDDAYEHLTSPSSARVFPPARDSEIVADIAREAGMTAVVDTTWRRSTPTTKPAGESVLRFLKRLAEENGFSLQLVGREMRFRTMRRTSEPDLSLRWEVDVSVLDATMSAWDSFSEVEVRGWDERGKRLVVGRAGAGDEPFLVGTGESASAAIGRIYGGSRRVTVDRPVRSAREAEVMARGLLGIAGSRFVQADAVIIGNSRAVAGAVVELVGIEDRFAGHYLVERAVHTVDRDGYRTSLALTRNTV